MKKTILKSILAGVLIALAGIIYLNTENKIVGSFLFSIGLIGVVILEANLFTGKIGYVSNKQAIFNAIIILIINLLIAFIIGLLYRLTTTTSEIMTLKMEKSIGKVLFDSILCGMCIYIAVETYKKKQNILCLIIPVMAFILGGGEHCVADAFYYGACDLTWNGLLFLLIVSIGNSIGSLIIRWLQIGGLNEISKNL